MNKIAIILNMMLWMLPLNIISVSAQEIRPVQDSLQSITIYGDTVKSRPAGFVKIDIENTSKMVTPLGEADAIKYIQTLPGISTGVEGTSSFYVRGGNLGNNVITLDGIRIYGYGHLLGLTSTVPNNIIKEVNFHVGGFNAESSNLLASHIAIHTKDGNFENAQIEANISNFIIGAYATAPIVKGKAAFITEVRVSPLQLEYSMAEELLEKHTNLFNDMKAGIYDMFGKVNYKINSNHNVYGEIFYSMDKFGYGDRENASYDRMQWNNFIGNIHWEWKRNDFSSVGASLSFNNYGSNQQQEKTIGEVYNKLGITSQIKELVANAQFKYRLDKGWKLAIGARATKSYFAPGSCKLYGTENTGYSNSQNKSENLLTNIYGELEYKKNDNEYALLAVRGNGFFTQMGKWDEFSEFNTEVSLSGSKRLTNWIGVEATFDWLSQYYHTLEGIPLGWSLDMIVPSSAKLRPERSVQYYGGLFIQHKKHKVSLGAYYKDLKNLIYFSEASNFFSSHLSSWSGFIKTGNGTSKGIEVLYEREGDKLGYKITYTWSKTTRKFNDLNRGKIFLAKYDRPHILNIQGNYMLHKSEKRKIGTNMLFTFQNGNLESVKSATYMGYLPDWDNEIILDYFSGINNLRLKDYIRLDIGCYGEFYREKTVHSVKFGIYNVLNRHNCFSLYYNNEEKEWKQIYIFPIMPSFSYSIEF